MSDDRMVPVPLEVAQRVAWPNDDADRREGQEQVASAVHRWERAEAARLSTERYTFVPMLRDAPGISYAVIPISEEGRRRRVRRYLPDRKQQTQEPARDE